jgi:hypothetical protein
MSEPSNSGPLVPIEAQLEEAEREFKKRQEVYPGWIASGRISQNVATHRLQCQRAIIDTLQQVAADGRLL